MIGLLPTPLLEELASLCFAQCATLSYATRHRDALATREKVKNKQPVLPLISIPLRSSTPGRTWRRCPSIFSCGFAWLTDCVKRLNRIVPLEVNELPEIPA
jgi:hypothetical protein